jgi:hypothetical protein
MPSAKLSYKPSVKPSAQPSDKTSKAFYYVHVLSPLLSHFAHPSAMTNISSVKPSDNPSIDLSPETFVKPSA